VRRLRLDAGTNKQTLILGLGNLLLSDEGVGVHVAQLLLRMELPSDVEVVDGGTGGFELIEHVRGKSKVVIIDCFRADAKPGSIARLTLDEVSLDQPPPFSVHEGGIQELLLPIQKLTPTPEVVLLGIVPAVVDQPGMVLSAEIESQMPKIVSAVLEEVSRNQPSPAFDDALIDLGGGD
jgi:hydrogenase maturation protease